jgi:Skp family chaperone for outer membrane proteins
MRTLTTGRWTPVLLAVVICLVAPLSWRAFSDEPAAADKPHRVPLAVLDVAKVFQEGKQFNAQMGEIKRQIEAFETEIRGRQADMLKLAQNSGSSPSSDSNSAQLDEQSKKLQADVAAKKAEFLQAEARVYFEQYQRIGKVVAQLAQTRGIGTVLRTNGDKMDGNDRNSVLQGVNRAIVYNVAPDLTAEVIATLNADQP